jgi:hypothetical protein
VLSFIVHISFDELKWHTLLILFMLTFLIIVSLFPVVSTHLIEKMCRSACWNILYCVCATIQKNLFMKKPEMPDYALMFVSVLFLKWFPKKNCPWVCMCMC